MARWPAMTGERQAIAGRGRQPREPTAASDPTWPRGLSARGAAGNRALHRIGPAFHTARRFDTSTNVARNSADTEAVK